MELQLEAFGDTQLSRKLLRFADDAENMSPVFKAIEQDFYQIEEEQFRSEGRFASGGWPSLALSTVEEKARAGALPYILQRTGNLFDALTGRSRAHSFRQLDDDGFTLEVLLDYAGHHQRGTRRMPQRRPVELREIDRRRWLRMMQRYLVTGEVAGGPLSGLLSF